MKKKKGQGSEMFELGKRSCCAFLLGMGVLAFAVEVAAESDPLEMSRPDYVVYRPQQPRGGKNADPTKRGDCYNDHFQVIWDDARKLYYAFWTQGSGEGYGDMHVCLSKSADRGKTWTYPKLIAGGEKIAEPKPRAVWQQPMLAKSGRLYCLWNQQIDEERLHHGVIYGAYSDDGGETWSKPEENKSVPRQYRDDWRGKELPNWCNWQRPLRLAEDNRFLVACTRHGTGKGEPHRSLAIEFWRFENIDENPEIRDIRITVLSGNKDAIRVPAGDTGRFICEEAGIVKLPDGRLFALMRTRNRHPYWVQSRDGGVSWSKPEPLRDTKGTAYLHPCSPCPIYDVNGCEAASGEYVAFIHNAYDDSIPPLGRQPRGPVYMIRGRFDPTGAQPIAFGAPELFSPVKSGNSYYASFTHADGEGVMWFAHQKHFLIGRRISSEMVLKKGNGTVSAAPQQVLVSPGNGALEKAQADVRRIIRANGGRVPQGGIEVVLADGVYRLDRPINFTEIDCGTNGSPIVWRAAHRGKAIISGAAEVTEAKIDYSAMPAVLIPEASRADMRAWHISGTNNIPGWRQGWRQGNLTEIPVQVHANGRRLKVATYPKQEFARTGRTVKPVVDSYNEWGENWYANFDGEFYVDNIPQLGLWAKEPDLWAFGMWRFEWSATTSPVLKIDPEQKIMCVDTNQNAYGFLPNVPFNVFNAFSEIKEKGEWALDRKARMLYVRGAARPDVSMAERLFTSWPTIHDVIFQDLVFEHARGQAIRFYNARRVTVRASLFRGIGDTAVIFGADSREAVIHGCDFEDLGKGAVNIRGGEQATLTPASNVVENCHIHHFGQVSPIANPAISMSGVGCRAQHNLIHHFAHQGIVYIGNDHYCGFNMIHDGVMYNNDAGSIYCGSYDWSRRGSVCEYNCIFMSGKQPLSSHVQGIYMDGWTSGVTVRGNIVNRASQGIYTSGGNDNVVVDNLIVNCQLGINLSSLGADSFAKGAALKGKDSFLYKKLLAGEKLYRSELWRTRYPRLLDLLAFEDKVEAHNAYWYKCTNNVMCATTGLRVGNAEKVLPTHFMTNNVELTGDPGFIDYEGFNWELKPDAPARKVLPQGTRFGEMGLYDSPWRFSPAVKHGANMSRPRPIRTEFDQGTVVVSFNVPGRQGSRWMSVNTATPQWREYVVELKAEADGPYRLNLIGGCGYKTAYDDVRIEGHPEFRGDFEEGAKGWTWNKQERPSSKGEQGTPHGIVEMADAASGSHVALANDRNVVTSPPFTMKKGEMIRVTLKAREYIPEFILPYWNR